MDTIKMNATVYMKSGIIINESVELENTAEEVKVILENYRDNIMNIFKNNLEGDFMIGFTMFRCSEIAAIKIF